MRVRARFLIALALTVLVAASLDNCAPDAVVYFPHPAQGEACDGEPFEVYWAGTVHGELHVQPFDPPTALPGDCADVHGGLALDFLIVKCAEHDFDQSVRVELPNDPGQFNQSMCERWIN